MQPKRVWEMDIPGIMQIYVERGHHLHKDAWHDKTFFPWAGGCRVHHGFDNLKDAQMFLLQHMHQRLLGGLAMHAAAIKAASESLNIIIKAMAEIA